MIRKEFPIPIVFCADGKFKNYAIVTMISVMANHPGYFFKFYLFCSSHDKDWTEKVNRRIVSQGSVITVIPVEDSTFSDFPILHHFSPANYFRILIPQLISDPKYIYLDSDIICHGSLLPLLDIPLTDQILAAVEDPIFKWEKELGMSVGARYFNSGVMLVNSEAWKKQEIGSKAIAFISQNPEKIRFVDQCALNAVLDGNWQRLPPALNQQPIVYREDFDLNSTDWTAEEILEAKNSPILIHFTGPNKPWHYTNPHPIKSLYWFYQKDSPFAMRFPEGMTPLDRIKRLFPNSLKQNMKEWIFQRKD
ncbi:Lipopolysaccharide biosynthesis protein, LPS:glycosyltransferase [Algoriphagus alkaliphilus]|uniref:Lipopolysaccharide biosynthesis protein, LPS:glycosyltransferase n=1 Tax=Algoriphagus alkaliphilus TaxID=279824 RepID=A0A1G5Y5F4_9BACT|nr:glycosyltransferase family 8 protein [Algoriphagus alkaliphilus]SDA77859.1 Lipopolysaccharide biosynthesis protein, LPS:glycosyltransferase [Algoriphagus alkaliphilus]